MQRYIWLIVVCAIAVSGCRGDSESDGSAPAAASESTLVPVETRRAAGQATREAGGGTSVMVFSVGEPPAARRLDGAAGVAFAEWVDGARRFVGYDWNENAYKVLDLGGTTLTSFGQEGAGNRRNSFITAANDGRLVVIHREDTGEDVLFDIDSGDEHGFTPSALAGSNGQYEFSPDGEKVAFNHVVDERSSVYLADARGANPRPLLAAEYANVGIVGGAWSPDSKLLLVEERHLIDECAFCWSYIVIDPEGRIVWTLPGTNDSAVLLSARWAGPGQLFVTRNNIVDDGNVVAKSAALIDVTSGRERPVNADLAATFLSFSPDGNFAITRLGAGEGWEQRCALVAVDWTTGALTQVASIAPTFADFETVFCTTVDWSADGTTAIVSAGGI